jgi:hypothetical protein
MSWVKSIAVFAATEEASLSSTGTFMVLSLSHASAVTALPRPGARAAQPDLAAEEALR